MFRSTSIDELAEEPRSRSRNGVVPSPAKALLGRHQIWVDGGQVEAGLYDRVLLEAGNIIEGPAVITEMDSTSLVLPGHSATVHPSGSLLIRPTDDPHTQED